jgi:hypothetical protein
LKEASTVTEPDPRLPVPSLPPAIEDLVAELSGLDGVTAVVLGGSRAEGEVDAKSDWDLGVYYRGGVDLEALRRRGEVHPPGAWGRIMNGGAWLSVAGHEVDVILRDAAVVEHWTERAERGEFEIDALLAYLAGVPTYSLAAECHVARTLAGEPPRRIALPPLLAEVGAYRWHFCSQFTREQARSRAARGDFLGATGQAARAVLEEAHARMCGARRWVLNEKRLVERAGLGAVQKAFAAVPTESSALAAWVERVEATLDGSAPLPSPP